MLLGIRPTNVTCQILSPTKSMDDWRDSRFFSSFNLKMKSQGRSVSLLLDNAGCHPVHLQGKYSNSLLPPNTTSKLQPLDLGIICNFKTRYRSLLFQYVIAKIDSANCASDVISSINVLVAIRWVAKQPL